MASSLYATNRLKKAREARGWSQAEMATMFSLETAIEVSQSLVQKWEIGERPITPDTALELARFMKVDIRDLVKRKQNG